MTAPAIETTEITLEDIAPGCEVLFGEEHLPCPNSAEWMVVDKCCGLVEFLCDGHKRRIEWNLSLRLWRYKCLRCGKDWRDYDGLPWVSVERL